MSPIVTMLAWTILAGFLAAVMWGAVAVHRGVAGRREARWRKVTGTVRRMEHVEGVSNSTYVSLHYARVEYPGPTGESIEVRVKVPGPRAVGAPVALLVHPRRATRAVLRGPGGDQ